MILKILYTVFQTAIFSTPFSIKITFSGKPDLIKKKKKKKKQSNS